MTQELIDITTIELHYEAFLTDVEALSVATDEDYESAAELAKKIAAKTRELADTDVVAEKKRFYREYKRYSDIESAMKKKLDALSGIVRKKIGAYVAAKEAEARRVAEERAIAAAVATDDERFLDMVPDKVQATPEVAGVSYATVIDFEITDPASVPEEYKIVDEKAIRAMVRSLGLGAKIPGVRVFEKQQMRVSA